MLVNIGQSQIWESKKKNYFSEYEIWWMYSGTTQKKREGSFLHWEDYVNF